jgi:NAD(P)-dependent dehydrogenase (short-subunit alcohol dehydrogenase family)
LCQLGRRLNVLLREGSRVMLEMHKLPRQTVLVTGGAGFIGTHLASELCEAGYRVRVLDSLDPQVHPDRRRPDYLSQEVELIVGDVRSPETVRSALKETLNNACESEDLAAEGMISPVSAPLLRIAGSVSGIG